MNVKAKPPVKSVDDAKLVDFNSSGELVVYGCSDFYPEGSPRVFTVRGSEAGAVRGHHAHIACSQLMVCLVGRVEVTLDDGDRRRTLVLDNPRQGLLVPPSLWGEQVYLDSGALLMVICDRPYEPEDYIRDRAEFLDYRRSNSKDVK